jgi:hypothetical protein
MKIGVVADKVDSRLRVAVIKSERQTLDLFGIDIDLLKIFDVPNEIVGMEKYVVIFIPPGVGNRRIVEELYKRKKVSTWIWGILLQGLDNTPSKQPELYIMDSSETPSIETFGKSANNLAEMSQKYADFGVYALGFYQVEDKQRFDRHTTTVFPTKGKEAFFCSYHEETKFPSIYSGSARSRSEITGGRRVIKVPLKKK